MKPFSKIAQAAVIGHPQIGDTERLHVLEQLEQGPQGRMLAKAQQRTRCRRDVLARFAQFCVRGEIGVIVQSTDCDHTRATYGRVVKARTLAELQVWMDRQLQGAEGPTYLTLVPPHEARTFRDRSRDLALEAFENGHPHSIHA